MPLSEADTRAKLIDPDYRLKQLEKLNRGKLSITCSKRDRGRCQGEAGA